MYKVWIEIEHEDRNGEYSNCDAPGASLSVFDRYDAAYRFADALQSNFEACTASEVRDNERRLRLLPELLDLLRQDVFTDAPEYADRVKAIRRLVGRLS